MNPHVEHVLYTVFKRKIGTTLTVAVLLTVGSCFISPAVTVVLGIATVLLAVWWVVFIING